MILNRTAGGQKKYRITIDVDGITNAVAVADSAYPGAFVKMRTAYSVRIRTDSSGIIVPFTRENPSGVSTRAPSIAADFYFVMPAEDVTILR